MTTLLLALALVSGPTTADQAQGPEPAGEPAAITQSGPDAPAQAATPEPGPGAPAPALEPAASPSGQDAAANSPGPSALEVLEVVALGEGILVVGSALAAGAPEAFGWAVLGLSPVAYWLGGDGREVVGAAALLTVLGVSAYNTFELSGDQYTYSDRFWLNMAAWHAGIGVVALAFLMDPPDKASPSTTPQVSLGLTPGGGALLVAGRF